MTNPTLERAARAAYDHPAAFEKDCWVDLPDGLDLTSVVVDGYVNLIEVARAVLMAVLPSLKRYDQIDDHLEPDDVGDWVRYADLQAILNDGEGE